MSVNSAILCDLTLTNEINFTVFLRVETHLGVLSFKLQTGRHTNVDIFV